MLCEQGQFSSRCIHEDSAARIGGVEVLSNLPEGDIGFHAVIYVAIFFIFRCQKKRIRVFSKFTLLCVNCTCSFCKDEIFNEKNYTFIFYSFLEKVAFFTTSRSGLRHLSLKVLLKKSLNKLELEFCQAYMLSNNLINSKMLCWLYT